MAKELTALRGELAEQRAENANMRQQLSKQEAENAAMKAQMEQLAMMVQELMNRKFSELKSPDWCIVSRGIFSEDIVWKCRTVFL